MATKKELYLEEYIEKLQEAADRIVNERIINNNVIYLYKYGCREGEQLGLFKEALSRVNEQYELKVEV